MENDELIPVVHFPPPPWTATLAETKSQTPLMSHENVKIMVKDGTLLRASTLKSHQNIIQNTVLKGQNFRVTAATKIFVPRSSLQRTVSTQLFYNH